MWYTHEPITMPERRVTRLYERPEVLAGEVGRERLVLVVAPVALVVGLDRGADRDELGEVVAELLELDLEADPDDAVRPERVGLGLHPSHRQLAGVVHRLRERLELHVLAPPADLEADVVDARAEHEAERAEPGFPHEEELVHTQVGGEQCPRLARPHLGETAHRIFGDARARWLRWS